MQSGLLWFDNDPGRPIAAKATAAAERFTEKFDMPPNVCYVSAKSQQEDDVVIPFHEGQLHLRPASNILLNHFWIGYGDS